MKGVIATLALLTFFVCTGSAGEPDSKNPVEMVEILDPEPFVPGLELDAFVAGAMKPGETGDALGGGVGLSYLLTKNLGINANYAVFAYDNELHMVSVDSILKFPVNSNLAPYLLLGGGLETDGSTEGLFRLGGGLDLSLGENMGIFADGIYNWVDSDSDFTIARFGVRIPF